MTIRLDHTTMVEESKMASLRLPAALLVRLDFIARNTDAGPVKNRSAAVRAAIEAWLPGQEKELESRGVLSKKAR